MSNITALSTIWAGSVEPYAAPGSPSTFAVGAPIVFSDPLEVDLIIYRGDSGRFRVTVSTPEGVPVDISAATWDCDIRVTEDATEVLATLDVTLVPGMTDTVEVVLTAEQSAAMSGVGVWDLEMTLGIEVQTLLVGAVVVRKDVSRA